VKNPSVTLQPTIKSKLVSAVSKPPMSDMEISNYTLLSRTSLECNVWYNPNIQPFVRKLIKMILWQQNKIKELEMEKLND